MKKNVLFFMKTILPVVVFFLAVQISFAQTTGRLENQTDAWGLTYSFTGELKNGKPNGMGTATYTSGNVIRYVGNFTDGTYNGKGTMFFNNGAFLTGEWKK